MNREYHRWHSPHLGRDMELLVFGHAGAKVLVFPSDGRFHEYEDLRMTEALSTSSRPGSCSFTASTAFGRVSTATGPIQRAASSVS